ncbi:MAG: hypothetical protein HKN29_14080 [Rhodothermales bacterium]|nr:hypothetical protein [Rhodothermales bacterium]
MGPKTVIDIRRPKGQRGNTVEYDFAFDRWYCGWDALHMVDFQGITFPENKRFAWCGPRLGLTPSNERGAMDTILRLPAPAVRVRIFGHAANENYEFEGAGMPLEAISSLGKVVDTGSLPSDIFVEAEPIALAGSDIRRIRIPSCKPVVFIRRIEVEYREPPPVESPDGKAH